MPAAPENRRAEFPKRVRDAVAKRAGYECSRCRSPTAGPHSDPDKVLLLGEAAHIVAAAARGPRASAALDPEQRRSIRNAIWLCVRCAKLIDRDDPAFSVEELHRMKTAREEAARASLYRVESDPLLALQTPQAIPPSADVFHPHTLRAAFTGRVNHRQALTRWWRAEGGPVRVISGMGGQGKSSLAWVWMREDIQGGRVVKRAASAKGERRGTRIPVAERPDGIIWWSFYAPELQMDKSFEFFVDRALCYVARGEVQSADIASLNEKVDSLLERMRHGRFLVILDGFERATRLYEHLSAPYDADLLESEPATALRRCSDERAGRFLRDASAGGRSRVLITSRVYPADVDDVENVERHHLDGLSPDESLELFRTLGVGGTEADILDACEAVGHHPLAVRLMIGYAMNVPGKYRGQVQALPDLSAHLTVEDRRRHIFGVAWDSLTGKDKEFFGRIAVFTQATSYDVLRNCSPYGSTGDLARAIERLEQRGFLSFDQRHRTYDMHPLVRQYAYAQMATEDRRQAARDAYRHLAERLPKQEITLATLSQTLEVYRQAMQGRLLASAIEIFRYRLYPILFFRIGECHTQVSLLEELIAVAREANEPVDLHVLSTLMHHLSTACNLAGHPRDGFRWALEAEAMLAPHDPSATFAGHRLVYIASSAMRLGMLRLATDALQQSVLAHLQNGDVFHEGIARLNSGWALTWSGRFDEVGPELDAAEAIFGDRPRSRHWQCILAVHRTRLALLTAQGETAVRHARTAYDIAIDEGNEIDLVRSRWALGASLVRLVEEDPTQRAAYLPDAETHLRSALVTCVAHYFSDFEMEIHIALAHWHFANGDPRQASVAAEVAHGLARAGGHTLKQMEATEILRELVAAPGTTCTGAPQTPATLPSLVPEDRAALWALTRLPCVQTIPVEHAESELAALPESLLPFVPRQWPPS